jgi:hypothetical protein
MNGLLRTNVSLIRHRFTRSYAVRRLPRPKDPLQTSKNATRYEVSPGVTLIHRPPPTSPTPHSLTTGPASPLLSPSPQSSSSTLPPPLKAELPPKKYHLTNEELEGLRRLRAEDPNTWTAGALAQKFGCSQFFVRCAAPLSREQHKKWEVNTERELSVRKDGWGERKKLSREIRQKRKEFWSTTA